MNIKNKLASLILSLCFLCVTVLDAYSVSKGITFTKAREILLERSDAIHAAAANTQAKRDAYDSLKTLWGPTVSVQAGEIWGEVHVDIDKSINTPLGNMPVRIEENKNFNGPRAAITGTMPIFTGGKILAEQRVGKLSVEKSEARQRAILIEQEMKLIGSYFGLQLAEALERVRRDMLDQQEKELARAKKFEAEGILN